MNVTRRQLFTSLAAAPLAAQKKAAPSRPNVVLVLADDLASWMVGCYGNKEIRTPNIDRVARAGVRFHNSFVCTPICSASRATLFTGRVPRQHGIHDFLTETPVEKPPQGQAAAPESFARETMISDMLAGAGYRCGYVGKWHMGSDTKPGHGFTHTYTMRGGSIPYNDPVLYLNGEEKKESGYLPELLTRNAVEFLDQQNASSPFFLTVAYFNPHTPYDGHPQKYYDLYANANFASFGVSPVAANALREKEMMSDIVGNIRRCAASVTALDDQIPVLQKKIFDKGLFDNTIFIFTSDNGYLLGRHGLWSKGLASDPINMYEESIGVPMIWNWPGRIPIESIRPELVSLYDLVPAIAEATGVTPPAGGKLPGRSYLAAATNRPFPKKQPWKDVVFGQFRNTEMVRDKYYKLVVRNEGEGPNELYDLRSDPRERLNLYENPSFVTVRQALTADLTAWRQRAAS